MTEPSRPPADDERAARPSFARRRREKLAGEIRRSREGNHTVPTWVLALLLAVMVGAFALLLYVS